MTPHALTPAEWNEIAGLTVIRESWGLEEEQGAEILSDRAYGVKFNFVSGSPGYVGDLFILQGDVLTDHPAFVLLRDRDGRLTVSS